MDENKITTGNPVKDGKRGPGRPKGSRNKTTATAKSIIEAAADNLGGAERLTEWAREDPANEKAFWATIYPKLLPLQVNNADDKPFKIDVSGGKGKLEAFLDAVAERSAASSGSDA